MTTCQPSGATRRAISSNTSRGVVSTRRFTKLKRTPRTPAASSARSSASVTPAATVATPRARPFDERPIVGAVAGRLHDHIALQPEKIAQRPEVLLRGIARGVLALRRVGERRPWAEYVAVGVYSAGRGNVVGLSGVGMVWKPVGVHLEPARGAARGPSWPAGNECGAHLPLALRRWSRRGKTRRAFFSKIQILSAWAMGSASI